MKLELGKEYLNRRGDTCVVLDPDFNGTVLTKYLINDEWFIRQHDISGLSIARDCREYDIIKEKPQELTLVQYVVLYTTKDKPKDLLCWGIYSSLCDLSIAKSRIVFNGHNFYGIQEVTLQSDGTKECINF